MKYCPYCGAGFSDGTVSFYSDCGKKLPEPKEAETAGKESSKKVTTKKYKPNMPDGSRQRYYQKWLKEHGKNKPKYTQYDYEEDEDE